MDEGGHPSISAESPESPPPADFVKSQRGRTVKLVQYRESSDDAVNKIFRDDEDVELVNTHVTRSRSSSKRSSITWRHDRQSEQEPSAPE